jgi:hypothetical protein
MKVTVFSMMHHVVSQKFTHVSEVLTASIMKMMSPDGGGNQYL